MKAKDTIVNRFLIRLGLKPHPSNWKHFAVGCLLGSFVFVFTHYELDFNTIAAIGFGTGFAFLIGLIKESLDDVFDWLDLIMTTLGGLSGALLGTLLTIFL